MFNQDKLTMLMMKWKTEMEKEIESFRQNFGSFIISNIVQFINSSIALRVECVHVKIGQKCFEIISTLKS